MTTHRAIAAGLLAALLAALIPATIVHYTPSEHWDADQLMIAARALLNGQDPYRAVVDAQLPWPLYYPLTAVLLFVPFAALSGASARIIWAMVTAGALGYAAAKRPTLFPAFLSAALVEVLITGQFAPLVTAAAVMPWLGFIWAAKPTVGLAMFAAYPSRRAAIGMATLGVLSLILFPRWPAEWHRALAGQPYMPAVLRPGGILLLLALLRWRAPEARLVAALACVPVTTGLYETLPLFLVCRSRWEGYGLAALTWVAAYAAYYRYPHPIHEPFAPYQALWWPATFVCVWLPALFLVLRPSPRAEMLRTSV